jgi:GT2 family glycosyltransferase
VIIPTYARPETLRACLESMAALDFPRNQFEVTVSDDGSPTPLEPVVASFRDRLRITFVSHSQPRSGPSAARNRGAGRAAGRYLAFIDDDCIAAPDWLTALAGRFARTPDHLIGGAIVNALPGNPFSTATQLIVAYVYAHYERQGSGEHLFNTNNLAVPAERFRELVGFCESLRTGEDYDFCDRWLKAGYRTTYAPEAVVRHAHKLTLAGFCRQHFNYGRGALAWRLRIARRTGKPLRGENPRFYWHLLRYPLTRGSGARGWVQALLVALSQTATAAGVLCEAVTEGWHLVSSHRRPSAGAPGKVVR